MTNAAPMTEAEHAALGATIVVLDADGAQQEIFKLPPDDVKAGLLLHEPRPLRPREREERDRELDRDRHGTSAVGELAGLDGVFDHAREIEGEILAFEKFGHSGGQ